MKRLTHSFAISFATFLFLLTGINGNVIFAQSPLISISPDTVNAWLANCNDSVTETLNITNNGTSPLLFNILQSSTFSEGFEEGLSKWNTTGAWGLSTTAYESGYSLAESPGGNYGDLWNIYAWLKDSLIISNKDSASLSFYIRHALECNYDYLYVQMSVNNGAYTTIKTFNCPNSSWYQQTISLSSLVNTGDFVKIRFYFHSDGSVISDGVYLDNLTIKGVGNMVPWLNIPVTVGIVLPGQTMDIDLIFKSLSLSGTYFSNFIIQSNDPANPYLLVPCFYYFNGYPILESVEPFHDFGSIMENSDKQDTVYISNTGCDLLVVDTVYCDQPEFVPLLTSFTLASGQQKAIPVSFHPTTTGYFESGLFINSNDTTFNPADPLLSLAGTATVAPALVVEPDTLVINLSCGDSVIVPVTVSNNGGSDLMYQLTFNDLTDGLVLYYPMDGNAADLSGNSLHGTVSGASPATDRFNNPGKAFIFDGINDFIDAPDAVYFSGNFTVSAWANETEFKIMSRLFDFGNGQANNNVLACMSNGSSGVFFGEIYSNSYSGGKVFSPVSLPLNEWVHLTFVYDNGQTRLYKNGVLWGSGSPYYAPQNVIRTINYIGRSNWASDSYYKGSFDEFRIYNYALTPEDIQILYNNNQPSWLTGDFINDTLAPGTFYEAQLHVNTTTLNAGTYTSSLMIFSNDPLKPNLNIPIILNVTGEPQGLVPADSLIFDTIMQHTLNTKSFMLYNLGCDTLLISDISCPVTEFHIPGAQLYQFVLPGDSATILVRFQPQDTGYFSGTITISTNDGPFEIQAVGFSIGAPLITLNPDSITATFTGCNNSGVYNLIIANDGLTDLTWNTNAMTDAGTAIGFDTYGQWVTLGSIGPMPSQGTIEFWQWSDTLVNYNNSFCTNGLDHYNKGIRFEENMYGDFGVVVGDDNGNYNGYTISDNLPVNSWHHIAVSWNKNTNQVWTYFDGNIVADGAYCDHWATQWTAAYIGVGWADWRWWKGMIDEFRIWNTLRTQQEILDNMTKGFSGAEGGLIAYWDMNEGTGTTVNDKTNNNHDGTTSGALWLISDVPIESFVSVTPVSGILNPGSEITLDVLIDGTGYNSGIHEAGIGFITNDPLHLLYEYPVSMIINGTPEISVNPTTIDFGDVMQHAYKSDSVLVTNSGCADLVIDSVTPYNEIFVFDGLPLTIIPHDSAWLKIRFGSHDVANYFDILTLNTNDVPVEINLTGNSYSAPSISVDPTNIEVWIPCNDSVMVPVTVYNNGGNDLIIQPGEISVSFDFGQPAPPFCSPSAYDPCCGIGTDYVHLGQIDNWSGSNNGQYADFSAFQHTILSAGGTYTINIETSNSYDQDAYAWIDFNNNSEFEESEQILYSQDHFMYHTATFTIPDWAVKNIPLRLRVGSDYFTEEILTSCNEPYYGEYEDYAVFIQTIVSMQIPQTTITPGASTQIECWFNATNLQSGDFFPSFSLLTNDPMNPVVVIQSYMNVYGAPAFTTDLQQMDFGEVMMYNHIELPLEITNTGCSLLEVWDAYSIDPVFQLGPLSFTLQPGQDTTIMIGFEIYWTGYVENNLVFITNAGDQIILATATGMAPPNVWISPNWLDFWFNCGESLSTATTIYNDGEGHADYLIEPCKDIREGLAMHYKFSGNTADSSGFERNLENNGAVLTEGLDEEVNGAWFFSNSAGLSYNDSVDITANLNPETITISLWAKLSSDYNSQDPEPCLFNLGGSNTSQKGITIQIINDSIVAKINVNNIDYTASAPAIFDEYFMITVQQDWYNLHLFINGNHQAETYTEGPLSYDTSYNKVGIGWCNAVPGNEHYFTGTLDEVRIYNRPLNWEEIRFLSMNYNALSGISFDPVNGIVDPYSTQNINITIPSDSATTGEHFNFYHLVSNDPYQTHDFFTIHTWLDGWPDIAVSPADINFDSVWQFTQVIDSVLIENPSCSDLFIWYTYTDSPNFYPITGYMYIPPHSSKYALVAFNPQEAGDLTDYLHLANDVNGENVVNLSGFCKVIPVIGLGQNSINTFLACIETKTEILTVYNNGLADLELNVSIGNPVGWLQIEPIDSQAPVIIPPGGSHQFVLLFDRTGLPISLYSTYLTIFSNDPYNGYLEVPVYMLIPNPLVGVDLGGDTTFCEGGSVVLFGGNFDSYLWNDGSTSSNLTANTPGTYWVDVADQYDCISSDTIVVTEVQYPLVMAGNDTSLCANGIVQLDAVIGNIQPPQLITAVIGSGTAYSGETGPNPFGTYYMDHRTQLLYLASELTTAGLSAGNITSLGFILSGVGNPGMNGMNIKIGTTNLTSLNGFVPGLTNVYSISYYYPNIGQNVFQLPVPYFWNGISNIIVEVCFDNNSWISNSAYQYTSIPGRVWAQHCDNCAPGCSLNSGSSYPNRANLVIHGDGDKSRYTWTGPEGFYAQYRNPQITNIQTSQSGWYLLSVNNGYGCFGYDSAYVNVLPTPTANAGPDLNILGYDSVLIAAIVSGGIPPYAYLWSPATDLNDPAILQPKARPLSTRTYTLTINGENTCSHSDQVIINVTPRYSVSGQVIYNNAYYSALGGVTVRLMNNAQIPIDSTETDIGGNFIFPLVVNGTYYISAGSTAETGGINSTDALGIARHTVYLSTLSGVRLSAADVNASQSVSAADALLVLHKTVGNIPAFSAGDWVFENKMFAVNGANVVVNIYGLCYGDVNASYIPSAKLTSSMELVWNGTLQGSADETVEIPVYLSEATEAGAITIGLEYAEDILDIEEIKSDLPDLMYTIQNGMIRIAWSKTEGVSIRPDQAMFTVLAKRKAAGPLNGSPVFSVMNICEIAGTDESIIGGRNLVMPRLIATESLSGGFYLGQNRPNPADHFTDIPFIIPEEGLVNISLFNQIGEKLICLTNSQIPAGYHIISADCSGLPNGVYLYRLTFENGRTKFVQSRRMVVSK